MQYNKTAEGRFEPLKQRNIDVGLGLERTLYIVQGTEDIYTTDLFASIVQSIRELREHHEHHKHHKRQGDKTAISSEQEQRLIRIVVDHVREATLIIYY